jgi:hypothetical protein
LIMARSVVIMRLRMVRPRRKRTAALTHPEV